MKFKIADILKPKGGSEEDCYVYALNKGEYIKITERSTPDYYHYEICRDNVSICYCVCFNDDNLELVTPEIKKIIKTFK